MACPFCATGQGGLQRNMSTAEIVEQVRVAAASARDGDLGDGIPARLSNIVFMGMGEPLANYRRVVDALHRICDPRTRRPRHHPSARSRSPRSGWCPAIHRLADEGLQVTLAVSLHTPDDELRDTLVPVNTRWPVARGLEAAAALRRRHRPPGVDRVRADPRRQRPALARRPAREARFDHLGRLVHVNLIPLNPTPGSKWDASPATVQAEFVRRVRQAAWPARSATRAGGRSPPPAASCRRAEPRESPAETSPAIDAATGG